jgi:uncharacterized membrane protein
MKWLVNSLIAIVTLVALALAGFLGAYLHHVYGTDGSTDWGTAGEWAGAVLSAAVLAVAITAIALERQHTKTALSEASNANTISREVQDREAERWESDREQLKRSQAARVGCYFIDSNSHYVDVYCRNDSDALIYDVRPFVIADGQTHRGPRNEIDGRVVRKVPSGGTRILPSQEVTFRLQLADADPAVRADIDASVNENGYGITFVDNAGNWWRKWGNLALEDDPSACDVSDVGALTTQRSRFVASQLASLGG